MNITRLGLAASMLVFLGACSPRYLIDSYFIPQTDKLVRATQAQVGISSGDAQTVNYYLQICDVDNGQTANCKTTLVLDSVLVIDYYSSGH
ncbi:MAG: hypothetical protein EA397_03845 [Deltaproteobacteria bacterium]|nr:MAG: hypothetical protein EA397_03845 [Deltaproteobacteria bacterium]